MRINTLVGNMPDSSGSIIKGIREIRERGTDRRSLDNMNNKDMRTSRKSEKNNGRKLELKKRK